MEERGPSSATAADINHGEPPTSENIQLVLYGQTHSDTYVIHVPKDQIYRVPPAQNAIIFNNRRQPKKPSCKKWCLRLLIVSPASFFIAGVVFATWFFVFVTPKNPTFSITQMNVMKSNDSKVVGYEIYLRAFDANEKVSIMHFDGGVTSLSIVEKDDTIAKGKNMYVKLDDDWFDVVKVFLSGAKAALPDGVRDRIEETKSNKTMTAPLWLDLKISGIPLHIKHGFLKSWDKMAEVECKFEVDTFGLGTKILEQECDTLLKPRR